MRRRETKRLPKRTYAFCVAAVPILCVDLVVTWKNKYLLVQRVNEPLAGRLWVPGGRVMRGERLYTAVRRILKEETNLDTPRAEIRQLEGNYEGFFKKSAANPATGIHTVSVVFAVEFPDELVPKVKLDSQSAGHCWSDRLPRLFRKWEIV